MKIGFASASVRCMAFVYLDITTEDEANALATLESEEDSKVKEKWKNNDSSLRGFCGLDFRFRMNHDR